MAGFLGLFSGRKAKFVDQQDNTPVEPQNKEAFFLDSDSAKTLGDTKFMRTPITIKRTFANGGELVQDDVRRARGFLRRGQRCRGADPARVRGPRDAGAPAGE